MTENTLKTLDLENPFLESLGIRLVKWQDGYAEMHLPVAPGLTNRTGRIHGGVICTLLDSVCGYCGQYSAPGEPKVKAVTLSLTTQFIGNVDDGLIIAKGFMVRRGRSVYFSRAEVWMDNEELLATAVGTFKYVKS